MIIVTKIKQKNEESDMATRRGFLAMVASAFAGLAWWRGRDARAAPRHSGEYDLVGMYGPELDELNREVLRTAEEMGIEIVSDDTDVSEWNGITAYPLVSLFDLKKKPDPIRKCLSRDLKKSMVFQLKHSEATAICPIKAMNAHDPKKLKLGMIVTFPIRGINMGLRKVI